MTAHDFAYWLQGMFEVINPKTLNSKQLQVIKDHLALVFTKVTPEYDQPQTYPWQGPITTPTYPTVGPEIIYSPSAHENTYCSSMNVGNVNDVDVPSDILSTKFTSLSSARLC